RSPHHRQPAIAFQSLIGILVDFNSAIAPCEKQPEFQSLIGILVDFNQPAIAVDRQSVFVSIPDRDFS
ncbi:hypothetical protein, partial [Fischerella thermalis]|uniref:hypothetical protein n=1 Tax=Fischerella thermalis TaxID=372787 RepID=UPI003B3A4B06